MNNSLECSCISHLGSCYQKVIHNMCGEARSFTSSDVRELQARSLPTCLLLAYYVLHSLAQQSQLLERTMPQYGNMAPEVMPQQTHSPARLRWRPWKKNWSSQTIHLCKMLNIFPQSFSRWIFIGSSGSSMSPSRLATVSTAVWKSSARKCWARWWKAQHQYDYMILKIIPNQLNIKFPCSEHSAPFVQPVPHHRATRL